MGVFELKGRRLTSVILIVAGLDFLLVGVCISAHSGLLVYVNHEQSSMIKACLAEFLPANDLPRCWAIVRTDSRSIRERN
jgi:hypothetical protein